MLRKTEESAAYINNRFGKKPRVGIILGTGLGSFVSDIDVAVQVPYSDIPHFPVSDIEGHAGNLWLGNIKKTPVVVMQGRFHYYEGRTMTEITFPVRVMKALGITHLFLSNAAGGMNEAFRVGDIMVFEDHINMMPNPLIGPHEEHFGPRFPDMSEAYDPSMIAQAFQIAGQENIPLQKGCYVAVTGPTYETPAEYKFYRIIGGDAIGMSTVPEVIVARQAGIKCFAMSVITDLGVPGKIEYLSHDMVQQSAANAEPMMSIIFRRLAEAL